MRFGPAYFRELPSQANHPVDGWWLDAEVEGIDWLRGHLSPDDELVQAARAAQALRRGV